MSMIYGYKWLQMTIKYKELELLAKSEKTKWVKEGASNLFAVARGNGSVFWIVRASYQKRRSVITLGRWPAMKAEGARELAPSVKILIRQGFSDDAIKNALAQTSDPRKLLFWWKDAMSPRRVERLHLKLLHAIGMKTTSRMVFLKAPTNAK